MDYLKNLHKALKLAKQLKVIEDSFNNNPSSSISTTASAASANITSLTPFSAMTKYQSYSTTPFSVTNHLICKIDKNRIQSVMNRFNIKNSYDTTFTEYTNSNQSKYYNNSRSSTIERTTTSATRLIRELKNIFTTVNKLKYKYIKAKKLGRCSKCKCCKLIGNNDKTRNVKKKYCCYTCKHITKIISKTIDKSLEKCNTRIIRTGKQENSSNDENLQNISPNIIVTANRNDELLANNIIQEVDADQNMPKSGIHQDVNSMSTLSPKNKETKDNTKTNNESELIQSACLKSQEISAENKLETVESVLKQINENIIKPIRPIKEKYKSQQNKIKSTNENKGWIKLNSAIEPTNIVKSQKTNEGFLKPTSQPLKSKVSKKREKINNETLKINVSQVNPTQENEQKIYDICKRVELWKQYGTPWLNDFADLYEPISYTEPNDELIFEASSISESHRNKPKENNNNYIHQSSQTLWQSPDLSPIPIMYKQNKKLNK